MAARAKTLLLLLAALCPAAFAHVPRASLVAEKPHPGVEHSAPALHRGPAAANALNAPGLSPCLCDERRRSRSTAKERDDESNLDYFGARYFSASLGRFTGVDPNNAGVRLGNPQSWNGYGYSINNPLRYVDPDGRDFLDAIEGFANAFGTNAVGGIGRVNVGSRPSEAGDFRLGQAVGDAASVVVGTLEVLGGFSTGAGGVAACGTGVGCVATPAAVATSSLLVVQGGTLAATGLGNLVVAAQDNNPTDTSSPGDQKQSKPGSDNKPEAKKPGSQFNPDGTRKNPLDQLEQIEKAQQRNPQAIEDISKSRQGAKKFLKDIKSLEDLDDLDDF